MTSGISVRYDVAPSSVYILWHKTEEIIMQLRSSVVCVCSFVGCLSIHECTESTDRNK